jgi:hypothetical protein
MVRKVTVEKEGYGEKSQQCMQRAHYEVRLLQLFADEREIKWAWQLQVKTWA